VSKEQQGACMGLMVLARSLAYVICPAPL